MNDVSDKRTLLGYDIDLDALAQTLRNRWRLVLAFTVGALVLAVGYLHLTDYTYTATLMVSPVVSSSSDNLSNKLGNLSGIASLAGISIGGDFGSQAFMLYQNGLYSRDVADDLSKRPDILQKAFYKQWDADARQWIQPSPLVSTIAAVVKGT